MELKTKKTTRKRAKTKAPELKDKESICVPSITTMDQMKTAPRQVNMPVNSAEKPGAPPIAKPMFQTPPNQKEPATPTTEATVSLSEFPLTPNEEQSVKDIIQTARAIQAGLDAAAKAFITEKKLNMNARDELFRSAVTRRKITLEPGDTIDAANGKLILTRTAQPEIVEKTMTK